MSGKHNLIVLYYNARSLSPKIDYLIANCEIHKPDIICITESWLSSDILNCEIAIRNGNHPLLSKLCNILDSFSFVQLVSQPTRVTSNGGSTLIDLVLSSSLDHVQDCNVIPPLDTSDHRGILSTIKWHIPVKAKPSNPRNIWKYALADFDKANELLSQMDMENILDETDVVQMAWTKFPDAFLETMEKCIPKGKIPERKNLNSLAYYGPDKNDEKAKSIL